MAVDYTIAGEVTLDNSKVKSALDETTGKVQGFGDRVKEIAAGVGLERITEKVFEMGKAFVSSSIEAYESSQNVEAQLDAVLKSTKDTEAATKAHAVTTGVSAKEHAKLSEELARAKSRLDDLNHTHAKGEDAVYKHDKAVKEVTANISRLEQKLNSTKTVMVGGHVPAVQMTRDALIGLSKSLQSTTTYEDETVLSAENMLLTFTNIGTTVFPDATKAVLDMSTALGQDTKNSAIQLGKALQDPILGVTALRRVGVAFSDSQMDVIKNLVNTGKTLDAQKLILKEISTEFGGSAAAAASTYAGKIKQLKNSFDDVKESIGKMIIQGLTPFAEKLKPAIKTLNDLIDRNVDLKTVMLDALYPILEWIDKHKILTGVLISFISVVGSAYLVVTITSIAMGILNTILTASSVIMGIVSTAGTILGTVIAFLTSPIGLVIIAVGALIAAGVLLVTHWNDVKKVASNVWKEIGDIITLAVNYGIDAINGLIEAFNKLTGMNIGKIGHIGGVYPGMPPESNPVSLNYSPVPTNYSVRPPSELNYSPVSSKDPFLNSGLNYSPSGMKSMTTNNNTFNITGVNNAQNFSKSLAFQLDHSGT